MTNINSSQKSFVPLALQPMRFNTAKGPVEISNVAKDAIPALQKQFVDINIEAFSFLGEKRWADDALVRRLQRTSNTVVCAFARSFGGIEKVAGFALLCPETDNPKVVEPALIAVQSDWQRQGIGIKLLSFAFDYCRFARADASHFQIHALYSDGKDGTRWVNSVRRLLREEKKVFVSEDDQARPLPNNLRRTVFIAPLRVREITN